VASGKVALQAFETLYNVRIVDLKILRIMPIFTPTILV
jgi:hypothetical protein